MTIQSHGHVQYFLWPSFCHYRHQHNNWDYLMTGKKAAIRTLLLLLLTDKYSVITCFFPFLHPFMSSINVVEGERRLWDDGFAIVWSCLCTRPGDARRLCVTYVALRSHIWAMYFACYCLLGHVLAAVVVWYTHLLSTVYSEISAFVYI